MYTEWQILSIVMEILNIIIHSISLFMLIQLYMHNRESMELLYILNLNIVEIFMNVCWFLGTVLPSTPSFKVPHFIVYTSIATLLPFNLYFSMIYITANKLAEVYLNIRYPIHWNVTRSKILVGGTWFLGITLLASMMLANKLGGYQIHKFADFFYLSLDFLVLIITIPSYSYIFHKYRQARLSPAQRTSRRKESIFRVFWNSRFYISALLVLTFLAFVAIPDLLYYLHKMSAFPKNPKGNQILTVLYHISFMSDGCIYILMNPKVSAIVWKKWNAIKIFCVGLNTMKKKTRTESKRTMYSVDIQEEMNETML